MLDHTEHGDEEDGEEGGGGGSPYVEVSRICY